MSRCGQVKGRRLEVVEVIRKFKMGMIELEHVITIFFIYTNSISFIAINRVEVKLVIKLIVTNISKSNLYIPNF